MWVSLNTWVQPLRNRNSRARISYEVRMCFWQCVFVCLCVLVSVRTFSWVLMMLNVISEVLVKVKMWIVVRLSPGIRFLVRVTKWNRDEGERKDCFQRRIKLSVWDISPIFSSLPFQRLKKLYPERVPSFLRVVEEENHFLAHPNFYAEKVGHIYTNHHPISEADLRLAASPKLNYFKFVCSNLWLW